MGDIGSIGTIITILAGVIAVAAVAMGVMRRVVRTEDRAESIGSLTTRLVVLEEWRARREERESHVGKALDEIREDLSDVRDKVAAMWLDAKRKGKRPEES